eukprot:TRINITY_DN442_c0_g1_i1.p1 TRINITY_DN442_c0_g1~~TRINITY_DN442_c0_g1_i1.p1  ORF type:complete len:767 (+),score=268.90 TRINITY_DN442_c0_g1_i1:40-2340(+)
MTPITMLGHSLFALALLPAAAAAPCVLENGYARFTVHDDGTVNLAGDLSGKKNYGTDVVQDVGMMRVMGSSSLDEVVRMDGCTVQCVVTGNTAEISGFKDTCRGASTFEETWTVTLEEGSHFVTVVASGKMDGSHLPASEEWHVRRDFAFAASSMYSMYDGGMVQMKQGTRDGKGYFSTRDQLPRVYALGGFGAVDHEAGNRSAVLLRSDAQQALPTQIYSGETGNVLRELMNARFIGVEDHWESRPTDVLMTSTVGEWTHTFRLSANNHDFPIFSDDLALGNADDLAAFMTGVYGSPAGQFVTHKGLVQAGEAVAQMATTIGYPQYGYSNMFNFFDPDNYMSTYALLMSGDAYLQQQVRRVIERSGSYLKKETGQLPHHFIGTTPTYQAISGEVQTGPNVFWILSALNYAKLSGDREWLRGYLPTLRRASEFLNKMYVPATGLYKAPGSLMIDVFIRGNFTTDTNAVLVGFFREFAEAELAVGNATRASELQGMADALAKAVETHLWSDDHYITQRNPDGSMRDFVDYDANFIAAAYGIPSVDRAEKIFSRVDRGTCPASHSWVSELYYGKQDTTAGNIGDSWTAMGRVTWFDSLARKNYGSAHSLAHFDTVIMNPLVRDVQRYTWMHERYNCDGTMMTNRTAYYFEYPSTTAMLLHRVRYGIDIGLNTVEIAPFGPAAFEYNVGTVKVAYSMERVELAVPGAGSRHLRVKGLRSDAQYTLSVTGCDAKASAGLVEKVRADAQGVVTVTAPVGDGQDQCLIKLTL